jgi:hypothetical protein
MKNITISIDDGILQAGSEYARSHNISFDKMVSRLIEQTVLPRKARWLDDTFTLMDSLNVSSDGVQQNREKVYRV